jgi:hypothetical protein
VYRIAHAPITHLDVFKETSTKKNLTCKAI